MSIEDYLLAKRSSCTILDLSKSRYPKIMDSIVKSLSDENLEFILIQSSDSKSEIVSLNDKSWVVFDVQTDIYMAALDIANTISDIGTEEFEDNLFSAITYIACNELLFNNKATLAKNIYDHYSSGIFSEPPTTPRTFARMFYIIFHEWAHDIADKDPENMEYIYTDVDEVFDEIVKDRSKATYINKNIPKNFYYQTTFPELYKASNRLECAVDTVAALYSQNIINDDEKFGLSVGGYIGFLHSSLICIHQLSIIDEIKNIVKNALNGEGYKATSHDLLYQRLRITRYLFSRIIFEDYGATIAEKSWNKFTDYLASVTNKGIDGVFEQLHRVIISNKDTFSESNNEFDVEYCLKKFYKSS